MSLIFYVNFKLKHGMQSSPEMFNFRFKFESSLREYFKSFKFGKPTKKENKFYAYLDARCLEVDSTDSLRISTDESVVVTSVTREKGGSRMKRSLSEYLPKKSKKVLIQAHVDEDLVAEVKAILEAYDVSLSKLVSACLQKFVDEEKEQVKK